MTVENATQGQTIKVLRHVYFTEVNTGYLFSYSDYGMIHKVSLRKQMSVDGSGVISDGVENAYVSFNYPQTGTTQLTDAPEFTQRTESSEGVTGNYGYSSSEDTVAKTKTFTISRPDGSQLLLTRSTNTALIANGRLTQTEVKKDGVSYGKSVYAYVNDGGGSPQLQAVTVYDDAGVATKVDYSYDQHGNVTDRREYGNSNKRQLAGEKADEALHL